MTNSLKIKILIGLSTVIIVFFFSLKLFKDEKKTSLKKETIVEDLDSTTNIIKDVSYRSKDAKGNEYVLNAYEGQIDLARESISPRIPTIDYSVNKWSITSKFDSTIFLFQQKSEMKGDFRM